MRPTLRQHRGQASKRCSHARPKTPQASPRNDNGLYRWEEIVRHGQRLSLYIYKAAGTYLGCLIIKSRAGNSVFTIGPRSTLKEAQAALHRALRTILHDGLIAEGD